MINYLQTHLYLHGINLSIKHYKTTLEMLVIQAMRRGHFELYVNDEYGDKQT
jgi:hypothetical protein